MTGRRRQLRVITRSPVLHLVVRRVLLVIPQVFVLVSATFVLLRTLPANPVGLFVGPDPTKASYEHTKQSLGLARPLLNQLGSYLLGVLHGDLGISWVTGVPVSHEIGERLPVTLQLVFLAYILACLVALPLGMYMAEHVGTRSERVFRAYALFAGAQPEYWWGLLFIFIFFWILHVAPTPIGLLSPSQSGPTGPTGFILIDPLVKGDFRIWLSAIDHFLLPVITLAFVLTGPILKAMWQSALDTRRTSYIVYAIASGYSRSVVRRMTFRNAVGPVLTLTTVLFAYSLGGAVLVETVFSLNGLGVYITTATLGLNFPDIEGAVVVISLITLGVYLLLDLLYLALDPRVRGERRPTRQVIGASGQPENGSSQ